MFGAAACTTTFGCGSATDQQRDLALLTWDAYADPDLMNLWRARTGNSIRYEIHVSDPTSVNRLRAGETAVWDFVNLNNPWARKQLWPAGLIRDLPRERFEPLYEKMFEKFAPPYHWAMSQPTPEPKPNTTVSIKVYSRSTINRDPPRMAQLTVINGKNMPREL